MSLYKDFDCFADSKYSRGVSSAWRTFAKANPMTKLAACAFLALAVGSFALLSVWTSFYAYQDPDRHNLKEVDDAYDCEDDIDGSCIC